MLNMLTGLSMFLQSRLSLKDEEGQGMTEYALILALIAVVVIGILGALGTSVSDVFTTISGAIDAVTP